MSRNTEDQGRVSTGDAEDPVARSDLPLRFAAGVVMAAVALGAIYIGGWPLRLLVAAAAALMLFEWGDMHRVKRLWSALGAILLVVTLLGAAEYLYPVGQMDEMIVAESFTPAWNGFGAILAGALLLGLFSRRLTMAGGYAYVGIPALALMVINWTWFGLTLWVMLVTWATDIFAYFAGRGLGGPKLAPRISPNKTWAGLIGGTLGAAAVGWFAAGPLAVGEPFLYLGAPMALLAQAGDLYESWVKRRNGVKDSGTVLPGHGGVLDRLDGLLPVVVATFLILAAGLWTG